MSKLDPILLWDDCNINNVDNPPSITPYLIDDNDGERKPVVLVIPGGGYGCVCESTEGGPIAKRFNQLGFSCFVLNYRVAPNYFPSPVQDAARAIRIIRFNANKFNIDFDKIYACGFSAGGHLAGLLGVLSEEEFAYTSIDDADSLPYKPNGLILSYPVISFDKDTGHVGSGNNLLGKDYQELKDKFRLDKRITNQMCPAFIWHTIKDQVVPFIGSVNFAMAMSKVDVPCQLQLYPYGDHGMLLGLETFDVSAWTADAANFFKTQWRLGKEGKTTFKVHYTNSEQARLEKLC